jgi:Protein of unknown function (DUF3892)
MADCQVTCITKPRPLDPHEHITHVGNPHANPPWRWTREQVIDSIDRRTNTFYVIDARTGRRADIAVFRQAGKVPFLRTHADGDWNDNLLSLPQCP